MVRYFFTLTILIITIVFLSGCEQRSTPPLEPSRPLGVVNEEISSASVTSTYTIAPGGLSGWFTNGQDADIMLSGIDFNNSGGPLLFNHPRGLATDGKRLALVDSQNNRVLIWNTPPLGNEEPDLVLGQADFFSNAPGDGLEQFNWPGQVSIAPSGALVVADTYNDRLLVWQTFPTRQQQPADFALTNRDLSWPWGVWTDGTRLVATSTHGARVLFWNNFPLSNVPPDFFIADSNMGTPRTITSDGQHLVIGDHNANAGGNQVGNFFWTTFPTSANDSYDYFAAAHDDPRFAWMQGGFNDVGSLVMLGRNLYIWNEFPPNEKTLPDLTVVYDFEGGDGGSVAFADGRLYVLEYNGNKIVAYDGLPTSNWQKPNFAIGSPSLDTNTLETNYFITNGVPASDGKSLFISSDFDRKLYVWKNLPNESGAHPDLVYNLPVPPWDNALYGETLILAGRDTVTVWNHLPLSGEEPERTLRTKIGNVTLQDIKGVAYDGQNFFLSDELANAVYMWQGIPESYDDPVATLSVEHPGRLSSDGKHLVVVQEHDVLIYSLDDILSAEPTAIGGRNFINLNLPGDALLSKGHLFIANTVNNIVYAWERVEDAIVGRQPDVILGADSDSEPVSPRIGQDTLFWPGSLAFDGSYLWVGEFKFSNRLLRFSVR